MKKVYYILCLLILTMVVIESPLFASTAIEADTAANETLKPQDFSVDMSYYELYIYAEDSEAQLKKFEDYLNSNDIKFQKNVKENNNSVFQYTFTNLDIDKGFSIYDKANNIIKTQNEKVVINLSVRGSVNSNYENEQIAKVIYTKLNFTPENILQNDKFFEADGTGYINIQKQDMQIVVRKSQENEFSEFIIGIPSVLNEY